jgi:hypothetical protein
LRKAWLRGLAGRSPVQVRAGGAMTAKLQVKRLVRTLSVPVWCQPFCDVSGTDIWRTGHIIHMALSKSLTRSAAIPMCGVKRSVKPSAKPTLVRTQHLPLPAETARELGIPGLAGCCFRSCEVPLCP